MLRPERMLRLLDQADCLGGALRLAWAGRWRQWLAAAALIGTFLLAAAATGLPLS